jgi:UDP-GlcNAc:undecaprenyl-phosphate GlcNAc-1-phosphate transferase
MINSPFFISILSVILVTLFSLTLFPLAIKYHFVDRPSARKNHTGDVPKIGGISMFVVFFILYITFGKTHGGSLHFSILITIFLICLGGVLDDIFHWGPRKKFILQFFSTLVCVTSKEVLITNLGGIFSAEPLILPNLLWEIFTVISIVGVINAINMLDGMDGLASSVSLIHFIFFGFIAGVFGNPEVLDLCLIMSGITAGFMLFNFPTAPFHKTRRIFLGDSGSSFLGFTLAWIAIKLATEPSSRPIPPISLVWVLALPLVDMARVMVIRMVKGKRTIIADHAHLHHQFKRHGYSVLNINSLFGFIAILTGFLALLSIKFNINEALLFWLFLSLVAVSIILTKRYSFD